MSRQIVTETFDMLGNANTVLQDNHGMCQPMIYICKPDEDNIAFLLISSFFDSVLRLCTHACVMLPVAKLIAGVEVWLLFLSEESPHTGHSIIFV